MCEVKHKNTNLWTQKHGQPEFILKHPILFPEYTRSDPEHRSKSYPPQPPPPQIQISDF